MSPSPRRAVQAQDEGTRADDPDVEDSGMVGADVVAQILGGRVIEDDGGRA